MRCSFLKHIEIKASAGICLHTLLQSQNQRTRPTAQPIGKWVSDSAVQVDKYVDTDTPEQLVCRLGCASVCTRASMQSPSVVSLAHQCPLPAHSKHSAWVSNVQHGV